MVPTLLATRRRLHRAASLRRWLPSGAAVLRGMGARVPLANRLSADEERDLISKWQASRDPKLLERLIDSQRGLIWQCANNIRKRNPFVDIDDLFQEGVVGFIRAVERFDPAFGTRLVTLAQLWILARQRSFAEDQRAPIRFLGYRSLRRIYCGIGEARRQVGDDPEAIAAFLVADISSVKFVLNRIDGHDLPLDALDGDKNHGRLPTSREVSPEDATRENEVHALLAKLPERDRTIIKRRYLSDDTLDAIGTDLGVSRERVRQLEAKALKRLRKENQ
jgi:RNA polymerase sigma-32 factor